jgi:uncharacterized protein YndB with AHSA1/START domain
MPDIMHLLRIDAAPERVYRALTTAEDVRNWWTRDLDLDETVGGAGVFRFYDNRVVTKVRIDAPQPPSRVGWTTLSSTAPGGWEGTTMSFDLRAEGDVTVLLFAHRGFAEASENYARVTTGWAYFLFSLQRYLETGSGVPAPDVDFTRVVRR